MDYFSRYLPTLNISYAHNCYLQIWAETGIFSLFSFLIFAGSLFWFGIKSFLAKKDYLLIGLLAGISAYLAHAFFDTALYSLPLAFLFWILAGLILAAGIKTEK
jgi:O-antigen ligase